MSNKTMMKIAVLLDGIVSNPNEVAYAICKELSGLTVYFPVIKQKTDLKELIKSDFSGSNQPYLAKKYGISLPHVYKILRGEK